MPGDFGQAHAFAPIPFVGIDTGVELPGEQQGKAFAQGDYPIAVQNVLDDQEAIPPEAGRGDIVDPAQGG